MQRQRNDTTSTNNRIGNIVELLKMFTYKTTLSKEILDKEIGIV